MSDQSVPIDVDRPSPARVYDYLLGGTANYQADREVAEAVLAVEPTAREMPRRNREFLGRVVQFLAGQGIDQFLDIGSGLPTAANVHEVAQQINPDARVVYVDNDASVHAEARALLSGDDRTTFLLADVRDPDLLDAPELGLLDWSRPVGVLLIAVLHFLPDADQPAQLVNRLVGSATPGSYMAMSHVTDEGASPELVAKISEQYRDAPVPLHLRSRESIISLLGERELVDPGLVDITDWHSKQRVPVSGLRLLGAVARL